MSDDLIVVDQYLMALRELQQDRWRIFSRMSERWLRNQHTGTLNYFYRSKEKIA